MKSTTLLLFFIGALTTGVFPQDNLVPNGGFEEVIECPQFLDDLHFRCAYWYKGIQTPGVPMNENPTPDWFHGCSEFEYLTPPLTNSCFQEPFEGQGYAALVSYAVNTPEAREVISVPLLEPLEIGSTYYGSFRCVAEGSRIGMGIGTNGIGALFTTFELFENTEEIFDYAPQGEIGYILSDTVAWNEVSFEFVADSNYQYLHIGCFLPDSLIDTLHVGDNFPLLAYIQIDDVKVSNQPLSDGLDHTSAKLGIYPNPCTTELNLKNENGTPYQRVVIYTSTGERIRVVHQLDKPINVRDLSKGIYFLQVIDKVGKSTILKFQKL